MLAKDANRGVERSVRVELSSSGHARILSFWERTFNNLAEASAPPRTAMA